MNRATKPVQTVYKLICLHHGVRAKLDHVEAPVKPEHVRCGECNAYCRIEVEDISLGLAHL